MEKVYEQEGSCPRSTKQTRTRRITMYTLIQNSLVFVALMASVSLFISGEPDEDRHEDQVVIEVNVHQSSIASVYSNSSIRYTSRH